MNLLIQMSRNPEYSQLNKTLLYSVNLTKNNDHLQLQRSCKML